MPVNQLTNPLAEENEPQSNGAVVETLKYDPAASGNLINGTVVSIEVSDTGPPFVIKASVHTTVDFLMWGVIVGAPTGGYTPGSACLVLVRGIVQVLFDANNTTHGHLAVQSATTDGTATDSATATLAKTLGTILQSVTISSGTALVWVAVGKM